MKRIGMLTSGGDCQALNAAMRGVVKTLANSKEDAAKPSGEAQDTQESSGEAPQEERIDFMTAQTSDSQESGTEQITETSGKGTNAGRVAAAAAAGAVVVGGGGAAVYVTMIKGKFKFK